MYKNTKLQFTIVVVVLTLFGSTVRCHISDPSLSKEIIVQDSGLYTSIDNLSINYGFIKLPPLSQLMDNARSNAAVERYDLLVQDQSCAVKTIRRQWLSYFKVQANYQYGVSNDISSFLDANQIYMSQYYGRLNNLYSVGATFSMPIGDIWDRHNKIKQQRLKVQQVKREGDKAYDELCQKIIILYTDAMQELTLIRTLSEANAVSQAQYKIAEADFINGKINASELGRQKELQVNSYREYELSRVRLLNALFQLELLSKTEILK